VERMEWELSVADQIFTVIPAESQPGRGCGRKARWQRRREGGCASCGNNRPKEPWTSLKTNGGIPIESTLDSREMTFTVGDENQNTDTEYDGTKTTLVS